MIREIPNRSVFVDDSTVLVELICDTSSELSDVTTFNGNDIAQGSIAIASKEAKLCIFASDEKWYCDGVEVTADA